MTVKWSERKKWHSFFDCLEKSLPHWDNVYAKIEHPVCLRITLLFAGLVDPHMRDRMLWCVLMCQCANVHAMVRPCRVAVPLRQLRSMVLPLFTAYDQNSTRVFVVRTAETQANHDCFEGVHSSEGNRAHLTSPKLWFMVGVTSHDMGDFVVKNSNTRINWLWVWGGFWFVVPRK